MRALMRWKAWVLAVGLLVPMCAFSQEMTVFDFEQYADDAAFNAAGNIGQQGVITTRVLETTDLAAPGSTAAGKGVAEANDQGWGQFWFGTGTMDFSPYDVLEFWGKIEGGCATGWGVKIGGGQDNAMKAVYFTDRWERYRIPFGSFTTIAKSDWDSGNPAPFNNITHMEIQLQGVNNTAGNVFLDAIKVVSVEGLADVTLLDFEGYNQAQVDEILLYGGASVASLETASLPPDGGVQAIKVDYDNSFGQSIAEITLPSVTNMMDLPYVTFWAKSSDKNGSVQVGMVEVDLINGDGRDLSPSQKLTDQWVEYSIPLCNFVDGVLDNWLRPGNWASVGKIQFLPIGNPGSFYVDNVRLTRFAVPPAPMIEDFEAYDQAALDQVRLTAGATSKTIERSDVVWGPDGGTRALKIGFDNSGAGYSMAEIDLAHPVDLTNCDKITFWAKGSTDNAGVTIALADQARQGCNVFEGLKVTQQWLKYAIPKSKFTQSPYWNQAVDWTSVNLIQIQPTGDPGEFGIDSIAMTEVSAFKDLLIENFERYAPDHLFGHDAAVTTASIETVVLPPDTTGTQALVMLWDDPEPRQWWGQAVFSAETAVDVSQAHAIRFWAKGSVAGQTISIKAYDSSWNGSSRVADIPLTTEWEAHEVLLTQFVAEDPLKPCDWTKLQNFQLQAGGSVFGLMYFDDFWAIAPPDAAFLSGRTPAADAEVETLDSVSVTFSEPMDGVVATLLSVNGSTATQVTTTDNVSFTFTGFAPPSPGAVAITLAATGAFPGETWVCSLVEKPEAVAEPAPAAPTLDGVLGAGEWAGTAYSPTLTVPGDTAPADAADLSAVFYVMHDSQYIYVAADVSDSVMAADPATGGNWENDTVEVFFDMDHDHTGNGQPGGQFGLTWDGTILGGNLQDDFEGRGGADSWSAAAATRNGGFIIEFRLLKSAFSTPANGATVGFNVQVQDNDGSGRESRLWWSSTAGDTDPWDNAGAWGHLLLKGGETQLTLSASPVEGGSVSADPASETGVYPFGTVVTLTATPQTGYRFAGWTGDAPSGHEMDNPLQVTLNASMTLAATFELIPTYTVTVAADPAEGGTVAKAPNKEAYEEGEVVSVTATPGANWEFKGWWDGATTVSTNATYEYTVGTANVTLTAKFKATAPPAEATIENLAVSPGDVAIAAQDPEQMNIFNVVAPGIDTVGVGKTVYLKAIPKEGSDAAISGYNWAVLTEPSAGAAVLETPMGDRGSILKWHATVEGQYVLTLTPRDLASNPTTTTQIAMTAAKFLGMNGGSPSCTLCHADQAAEFVETAHANKLKMHLNGERGGYYQTSCLNCHAVGGWAGSASTGDDNFFEVATGLGFDVAQIPGLVQDAFANQKQNWDALPQELQKMGGVQCESCHGPGSQHKGAPATISGGAAYDAKVCAHCHDAPTYYMETYEWKLSGHSVYLEEEASRVACQSCHTAQGFVEIAVNGESATSSMPESGITCVACHDPHNDENPAQLRTVEAVTLPNKQVFDGGSGNLCANCHHSRIADPNVTNNPDTGSYRGAHYGPMADVMLGSSAYDWGTPFTLGSSVHYRVTEDSCVQCHQGTPTQQGVTNPVAIGGHTFQINLKIEDNSTTSTVATSCATAECHPGLTTTDRIPGSGRDYNGNGTIEGVQTEVAGILEILKTELVKIAKTTLDAETGVIGIASADWKLLTQDQRGALYNYNLIVKDKSRGIHNGPFTVAVLQRTYGKLMGTSYKEAYPNAWIVEENYGTVSGVADPTNGGTISRTPDRPTYQVGRTVTLKATPADGWIFTAWLDGATTVSTEAEFVYTVEDADKVFTARFEQLAAGQYTVTLVADPANGGTVSKTPDAISYSVGTQLTLNAVAAEGWAFVAWMDGATTLSTAASFPYSVTAAYKTLTAKFEVYTGPPPPSGVTAVGNTYRVLVSWQAVAGAAGYVVTRTLGETDPSVWSIGPVTEFADDIALPGLLYTYTVKALDAQQQESAPSAPVTAAVTAETIATANYKVTAKGYTMARDEEGNLTFTGTTAGTIKIALLKKLPANAADNPAKGLYYLTNQGQVPTLTINGDVKTLAFDVPVFSLYAPGLVKSVSAKSVTFLTAGSFDKITLAATKPSEQGWYARTYIETMNASLVPMLIKATGAVIEEVDVSQPIKLLNVASKVYKDAAKAKKTSLGAIGSLPRVVADLTNTAPPASEATPASILSVGGLKAVTVSGGPLVADELVGAIDKVMVTGGNLRPGLIQSSKDLVLVQAKAKKVAGVEIGGAVGTAGQPEALIVLAQPNTKKVAIGKIYGQTGVSGYFYAGYDATTFEPTLTGGINIIQTKTGTIEGAAFLDPTLVAKMKLLPKGQTIPTNPDL